MPGCRGSQGRGHLVSLGAGRPWSSRIWGSWVPGGPGEDLESVERAGMPECPWVSGPGEGSWGV